MLAAALPLWSCAPAAEEPDAGLPDGGPVVLWVQPEDGAADVAIDPVIRVGVSEHLDDTALDGGSFKLYSGPLSYWLMAYYDPVSRSAVVWPSAKVREDADWVFEAREGIADREGRPLAPGRLTGFATGDAAGGEKPFPEVDFATAVAPILAARCASCHGGTGPVAGLALDTADGVIQTAIGAPSTHDPEMVRVFPSRPGRSHLVYRVVDDEPVSGDRMPRSFDGTPAAPLTQAEQQLISDWIAGGAATGP
jgi:hypothetical protein